MKERNISITLEKAQEWYNSGDESLKEIALQAFNENELKFNFRNIKTLEDACNTLNLDYKDVVRKADCIELYSKASASVFKLNIVKKALNLGHNLNFAKDSKDSFVYYPYNPFVTKSSICYKKELRAYEMRIIGKLNNDDEEYYLLGNSAYSSAHKGLSNFNSFNGVCYAFASCGFLGCANKEIAKHFSLYFGVLITEAKYGDLKDFEIIRTF